MVYLGCIGVLDALIMLTDVLVVEYRCNIAFNRSTSNERPMLNKYMLYIENTWDKTPILQKYKKYYN